MGQVTISGTVFDVYGTEASAKAYLSGKLSTPAFDAADTNSRKKAQVSATRFIDRARWQGEKTDPAQVLDFPRTGLVDCDTGEELDPDTVPLEIEHATYELMEMLLADPTLVDSTDSGSNIKRVKAGSAEVENFRPTQGRSTRFPTVVHELVSCFLASSGEVFGPFASGTDAESQFDSGDEFDVSQGYN